MLGFRWTIGIFTTVVALGVMMLATIGGGFRRSFGVSDNSAAIIAGVLLFAALALASVIWPERRPLMHVVAVLMLALCIALIMLVRQTVFIPTVGTMYAVSWLIFYYRTVWER